jgi:hypothetical protein
MRTQTLDDRTQASDPGKIRLSHKKMAQFHPELYERHGLFRLLNRPSPRQQFLHLRHEEHLMHGDSRAAIVISLQPLIISAYTDELDCVALLKFPEELIEQYALEVRSRLLTVNLYFYGHHLAGDLQHGDRSYYRYCNFTPFIAEFLSDDIPRIEYRKSEIGEPEWQRTEQLTRSYITRWGMKVRDGRPLRCSDPAR